MKLKTTIATSNGQLNGYAGFPGLDKTDAAHLDQRLRSGNSANGSVADTKPKSEQIAGAMVQPSGSGSTEIVAKPRPRRSKIKYVPQAELDAELAKLQELSQAALAGDTAALDQLRTELDNCPHVWRRLTDLQQLVEHKLIELIAGIDPLRAEAFRKRCSELRHELLEGEVSSLLVKMAASRVVMCWMFCQFLELRALEDPQDLRCIKQLEQSERRYQVAMRTFQMARHADLQLQKLAQQSN